MENDKTGDRAELNGLPAMAPIRLHEKRAKLSGVLSVSLSLYHLSFEALQIYYAAFYRIVCNTRSTRESALNDG